jgi:hypothetical protein
MENHSAPVSAKWWFKLVWKAICKQIAFGSGLIWTRLKNERIPIMNKLPPLLAGVFLATATPLMAQTIYTNQAISAQAEIFGAGNAGLPDGSGQAPPEFALPANASLLTMISVTGTITLNSGTGYNNPDGVLTSGGYYGPTISGSTGYTVATAYGGISGITIPGGGALEGVFEPAAAPTGAAPASLNFTVIGTSFSTLSPLLYQTFYIGDGLTGNGTGTVQQFVVPAGATRLFLGISDAPGFDGAPGAYSDNSGHFAASFQITSAVPQLLPPQVSGSNFLLSFQSVSSQSYLVESSTNLAAGNWVTNTSLTGDGTIKQITVPTTNNMQFFRVAAP